MDNFVVLVKNARFDLHPCFFDNSSLANCKKVLKDLFREPWRNESTITRLNEYLRQRTVEEKTALDADPANKHVKRNYERYGKILVYFETLKTAFNKIKAQNVNNVPNEI